MSDVRTRSGRLVSKPKRLIEEAPTQMKPNKGRKTRHKGPTPPAADLLVDQESTPDDAGIQQSPQPEQGDQALGAIAQDVAPQSKHRNERSQSGVSSSVWVDGGPHFRLEDGEWVARPPVKHRVTTREDGTRSEPSRLPATEGPRATPTLLTLPEELRREIWGHVLRHDCLLIPDSHGDAVRRRQAPADMARFNHIRREHLDLLEVQEQNPDGMTGLQKRRLRELEAMNYMPEMEQTLQHYDLHRVYIDTSLLEVCKQVEAEAKVEFLRVNDFVLSWSLEKVSGLGDEVDETMVHPREFDVKMIQIFKHALSLQLYTPWHDITMVGLRLAHRNDLKYLRLVFLGPVGTVSELKMYLKPLEMLRAHEVDLEWQRSEHDPRDMPRDIQRHKYIFREAAEDHFDALVRIMEDRGPRELGGEMPEAFREGYWKTRVV